MRFEVLAPVRIRVSECNCSICSKSSWLHLIVPAARFKPLSGADALTTYTFDTGTAKHLFCSVCGIKSIYVPRSHPDGFSVNACCFDPDTVQEMKIEPFDGRNWEQQYPAGRGEYRDRSRFGATVPIVRLEPAGTTRRGDSPRPLAPRMR